MSVPASAIEIRRLMGVAHRELTDAAIRGLSSDGSFEHAYVAALMAATIAIRAHGERIHGAEHHRLRSFGSASWWVGAVRTPLTTCSTVGSGGIRPCMTSPGASPRGKLESSVFRPSSC